MLRVARRVVAISIASIASLSMLSARSDAVEILVPEDYRTIQAALDVAVDGDVVSVAPRTYRENVRFVSSGVTLRSRVRHGATIQGDGTTHVVVFNQVSGTVEGFVITGSDTLRAGVFTSGGQQVIRHNMISGNYEGVVISSNSNALIEANQIVDNGPSYRQMGIRIATGASATIVNNLIARSYAGIWSETGDNVIINNTIVGNTTFGMFFGLESPISQIASNIVTDSEYGIYASDFFAFDRSGHVGQFLEINYNLLWNNSVSDYYAALNTYYVGGGGSFNSGPFDPLPGTNEVRADPLLDPVTEYGLSAGSAAIDVGDIELCPESDLAGTLRPFDGNEPPDGFADCDIGAIEYLPEPAIAATLAAGTAMLVLIHRRRTRARSAASAGNRASASPCPPLPTSSRIGPLRAVCGLLRSAGL